MKKPNKTEMESLGLFEDDEVHSSWVKWCDPIFDIKAGRHRFVEFLLKCEPYTALFTNETVDNAEQFTNIAFPPGTLVTWLNIPQHTKLNACSVVSVKIPYASLTTVHHDAKFWLDLVKGNLERLNVNPKVMNEDDFSLVFSILFGSKPGDVSISAPIISDEEHSSCAPAKKSGFKIQSGKEELLFNNKYFRILSAKRLPVEWSIADNCVRTSSYDKSVKLVHVWQMWFREEKAPKPKIKIQTVGSEFSKFVPKHGFSDHILESDAEILDEPNIEASRSIWLLSDNVFNTNYLDKMRQYWEQEGSSESCFGWIEEQYIVMPEFIKVMPLWDMPGNKNGSGVQHTLLNSMRTRRVSREIASALLNL